MDAKSDIDLFRFDARHAGARLIWSRQNIMWAGFNMVVAELETMREAVAAGPSDWSCCSPTTSCRPSASPPAMPG